MPNIVVPEMGESIVDARVARWLKHAGDAVAAGEPLVELETDKVDVEVSAPVSGVLQSIAQAAGSDVKIGEILGVVAASDGVAAGKSAPAHAAAAPAEQEARRAAAAIPATPSARKAAREQQVDLAAVTADGPRVTKADVDRTAKPAAAASVAAPPAASVASTKPAPSVPAPSATAGRAVAVPTARAARAAGERTEERIRMSKHSRRQPCSRPSTRST